MFYKEYYFVRINVGGGIRVILKNVIVELDIIVTIRVVLCFCSYFIEVLVFSYVRYFLFGIIKLFV